MSKTNKAELSKEIAYQLDLSSPAKGQKILDAVIGVISAKIKAGDEVHIQGFGTFIKHSYKATVKAPMMEVAEERTITKVRFKPSKSLK